MNKKVEKVVVAICAIVVIVGFGVVMYSMGQSQQSTAGNVGTDDIPSIIYKDHQSPQTNNGFGSAQSAVNSSNGNQDETNQAQTTQPVQQVVAPQSVLDQLAGKKFKDRDTDLMFVFVSNREVRVIQPVENLNKVFPVKDIGNNNFVIPRFGGKIRNNMPGNVSMDVFVCSYQDGVFTWGVGEAIYNSLSDANNPDVMPPHYNGGESRVMMDEVQ